MEVRVILEPEPHTSPRSQGMSHSIGMEDLSTPIEQGVVNVQLSKTMKFKEIQFELSLS